MFIVNNYIRHCYFKFMESSVKIFSYPRCGTCKKAINWLNDNKINYQLIDIIKHPPSKQFFLDAIKQLGDRKYLLNTSGKSYRNIGSSVIKNMNDNDVVKLLLSDSKLIKRPLLLHPNGDILVGFKKIAWEDFFLN